MVTEPSRADVGARTAAAAVVTPNAEVEPTDDLYVDQWHFDLMGNGGGRSYIETIWSEYSGEGINVGVYDSGVQSTHYDLNDNYDASLHVVVDDLTLSGDPVLNPIPDDFHGTAVAGIIGAELDGDGVVGIAWGSSLTGVNIFDSASAAYINAGDFSGFLEATEQMANFDVTNNSWGAYPGFFVDNGLIEPTGFAYLTNFAFEYAIVNGRGGLGTNIVKSSGNENLDSNGDGLNASRYTITVAALLETGFAAYYSNYGANTLVSAAGGDAGGGDGTRLVTTTDLLGVDGIDAGDFTNSMNGTSAAAPMVTGVIALMLDANENLGWRDVQNILALTAFHTGSEFGAGPGLNEDHVWYFNGADNWNGGGMHFSEDYGYGNVDVFGAVRLAESFAIIDAAAKTSANEVQGGTSTLVVNLAPTDNSPNAPVTYQFVVTDSLDIEHVELTLNFNYQYMSDLEIILTSPDGTEVVVQTPAYDPGASLFNQSWVYGIEALRGELSAGTWTISFADYFATGTGTINTVELDFYGSTPGVDDVYYFTDEFSPMVTLDPSRATLSDTNGGVDWINMAAMSFDLTLNLTAGVAGFAGLVIAGGTVIENAITGDGDDTITGNSVANTLYGIRGSDTLNGGGGVDLLYGGAGDDTLSGGAAGDSMFGGLGNDTYVVDDASDVTLEDGAAGGLDLVRSSVTRTLGGGLENLTLTGADAINGTGNSLANLITGNGAANILDGRAGDDILIGAGGDDTYIVDSSLDLTTENSAAGGTDLVKSSVTRTLGANLENLTLTGAAAINGTGNGLANVLTGNGAANILDGKAGADTMIGGAGGDTYIVDNAGDVTQEASAAGGIDLVKSSVTRTLTANLENLTLTGGGSINGSGNTLANVITGNTGANSLSGLSGADTLVGGGGADTLIGGVGIDTLTGGAGGDKFVLNASTASTDRDVITDFTHGSDKIQLENSVFSGLGAVGTLAATKFWVGAGAHDADDRIIYDNASGKLYYDANGNAAGSKFLIATLDSGLTITNTDFQVI